MSQLSRVTTWSTNQILKASDLNGEFNNIVNAWNNIDNALASWTKLSISGTLAVTGATTLTGLLTVSGGILGTSTNDNATAGNVGECINSNVARSAPVSTVASTAKTVTSVSLTAGDWDIRGAIGWRTQATTTTFSAAINTSTNTLPTGDTFANFSNGAGVIEMDGQSIGSAKDFVLALPVSRCKLASTTTIYLVQQSDQANNVYGYIEGRRIR